MTIVASAIRLAGGAVLVATLTSISCAPAKLPAPTADSNSKEASPNEGSTTADAMSPSQEQADPGPSGPITVTFEQLDLGMQPDSVYQPWMMTERVAALEGKQVRITGFMSGALLQLNNVREFPLMREQECPFGDGGQAHHVIMVQLVGRLRTSYKTGPITVEGTFSIQPYQGPNGKTWALYHLAGERVE